MGPQEVVEAPHLLGRLLKFGWRGRSAKAIGRVSVALVQIQYRPPLPDQRMLCVSLREMGAPHLILGIYIWKFDKKLNFWYNIYIRWKKKINLISEDILTHCFHLIKKENSQSVNTDFTLKLPPAGLVAEFSKPSTLICGLSGERYKRKRSKVYLKVEIGIGIKSADTPP